jgi:hypothetical protein
MYRLRTTGSFATLVCSLLLSGCSRFKTSDELRAGMRAVDADSSWMRFPCQSLTVDAFGWTLDALDGIEYRVHPSLRRLDQLRTVDSRSYASRNRRLNLRVDRPIGLVNIISYSAQLAQMRREQCSIADRAATVVVGRRGLDYETSVLWDDIGDGRQLRVTARGRSLAEAQQLRATFFTIKVPGA